MSIVTGTNKLVSRSSAYPVTNEMLLNHIQVSHSYDDNVIYDLGGYLAAATEDVENRGNVALVNQSRKQTVGQEVLDAGLKYKTVALTVGPAQSITEVGYIDSDGADQVLDAALYRLTEGGAVYFLDNPPSLAKGPDTVWIDYVAGYGAAAADVPSKWRHLVMVIACRMYDFRGLDSGASNDSWERMIKHQIDVAGGSHRGG
jgi:uncharacterized phiE125 gp8 family phage protein